MQIHLQEHKLENNILNIDGNINVFGNLNIKSGDIETNIDKALKSNVNSMTSNDKALLNRVSQDISEVITILSELLKVVVSEVDSDKN